MPENKFPLFKSVLRRNMRTRWLEMVCRADYFTELEKSNMLEWIHLHKWISCLSMTDKLRAVCNFVRGNNRLPPYKLSGFFDENPNQEESFSQCYKSYGICRERTVCQLERMRTDHYLHHVVSRYCSRIETTLWVHRELLFRYWVFWLEREHKRVNKRGNILLIAQRSLWFASCLLFLQLF